jgi:hypothetical protein
MAEETEKKGDERKKKAEISDKKRRTEPSNPLGAT